MSRLQSIALLLFFMIIPILGGCKTHSAVGYNMILPPGAEKLQVPDGRTFLMASPISQSLPDVPQGFDKEKGVSVCVEFVIAEDGSVTEVTPLYSMAECPLAKEQIDQRVVAAAVASVSQWQFLAAAICEFPSEIIKNDDCSGNGVVITAMPIKVSYVFVFSGGHTRTSATSRHL
jgi:hypothetical protein